jgi:glyoxylase-like metal-dependent hydrolase (beta-lactamase superfamily II)
MFQLKIFPFNPLQVNSYLLYEPDGDGIIIDPSCMSEPEFSELGAFIRTNHISLKYILNTHGHFDHLFGVPMVKAAWGPQFLIHRDDELFISRAAVQARSFGFEYDGEVPAPDGYLEDGQLVTAGAINLIVITVPGHSRGGVAFYDSEGGRVFTGDSLFAGGIGRTDLPGGDYDQLITSIREKLLVLPGVTRVFPGHGPSSTIANELQTNPFL